MRLTYDPKRRKNRNSPKLLETGTRLGNGPKQRQWRGPLHLNQKVFDVRLLPEKGAQVNAPRLQSAGTHGPIHILKSKGRRGPSLRRGVNFVKVKSGEDSEQIIRPEGARWKTANRASSGLVSNLRTTKENRKI